jgi:cytochrome c oxidase subunit 3/cytochrome o ubiquinol oxidase subunit 3
LTDVAANPTAIVDGDHDGGHGHVTSTGISNEKLAMWAFLGSECLLFGGLISTFMLYKNRAAGGETPHELYDLAFTSISSFVLLMSSLTMVLAVSAIARGDHRALRTWLLTTALMGAVFLSGQVYEFTEFVNEGYGFTHSPAWSALYALTGLHGVHVALGIVMLLSALVLSLRGYLPRERAEAVEIVGLYWHFVDVIWIIIFTVVYLVP